MLFTPEISQSINDSVLCWLATVDDKGCPNVSPKEVFLQYDDSTLVIANIASPQSVSNIQVNPAVCVSFIDVFLQKGFKIKGRAIVLQGDEPDYKNKFTSLYEITGNSFPIKSIISINVESAQPIIAPSYFLFPETTEQEQIKNAMENYGVKPR